MTKRKGAPPIKHKGSKGQYLTPIPERVIEHDAATGKRVPVKLDRKRKLPPK